METNSQVLAALEDQRHLLQQLVWIGAVIAAALLIRLLAGAWATWRKMRQEGFSAIAVPAYMERRLDELTQMCRERIGTHPTDPYPHFYLGLALFEQGQLSESVPHFERAQELSPAWGPQVQAYLQRVRNEPRS